MPEVWEEKLKEHFPGSVLDKDYLIETKRILKESGFKNDNTLPCVCLCRDEICCVFRDEIDVQWEARTEDGKHYARSFTFSALGGLPNVGRTGFGAALGHSPVGTDGRRRYVFFAFPHIGIGKDGQLGKLERQGINTVDHACGALVQFERELEHGPFHVAFDPSDAEYSLLKQKLLASIKLFGGEPPKLAEITETAHKVISDELTTLLALVDTSKADYAVLTGIQIHAPHGATYIQPKSFFVVHNNVKKELHLHHH